MQELPRVVGAVAQAGPVEAGVGSVDVLGRVSLHEQVDGHHSGALQERETRPDAQPTNGCLLHRQQNRT